MRPGLLAVAALSLAFACVSVPARADEQTEFEKARAAYEAKNYDDADKRFRALLTGGVHDPALLDDARMYMAAILFARGQQPDAAALVEKLLLDHPEYEPDPLRFPQDVINFFIDTRRKILDKIAKAKADRARQEEIARQNERLQKERAAKRLALLEKMAGEEIEIEQHSRLFALLPFGAGQFQNGQKALGWIFLGSESALFAAASITFPIYRVQLANSADAYNQGQLTQAQEWRDRAMTTRTWNLVLFGAFAATAVGGILHAQLTFVAERTVVRTRPIPNVALTPQIVPLATERGVTGGTLGFSGTF
jgi:hypothetical protein